jgi:hypothetical protein
MTPVALVIVLVTVIMMADCRTTSFRSNKNIQESHTLNQKKIIQPAKT